MCELNWKYVGQAGENFDSLMDYFSQGTQFKNWLFTKEQLAHVRQQVNESAVANIKRHLKEEARAKDDGVDLQIDSFEWITPMEQLQLCSFYETKVLAYCRHFRFPAPVHWTAIMLFKKFYLKTTIMDYDVKLVVPTCVFMASKIENNFISLDKFLNGIPKPPPASVVLDLELAISCVINFEYYTWHVDWSVKGFLLRLQQIAKLGNSESKLLSHLAAGVEDAVRTCYLTDLPLIYSSGCLGFGILVYLLRETQASFPDVLDGERVDEYAQLLLRQQKDMKGESPVNYQALSNDVSHAIKAYKPPNPENLKKIVPRLARCENPEFNPATLSFKNKEAAQNEKNLHRKARQREHKSSIQAGSNKRLNSDSDVFK